MYGSASLNISLAMYINATFCHLLLFFACLLLLASLLQQAIFQQLFFKEAMKYVQFAGRQQSAEPALFCIM